MSLIKLICAPLASNLKKKNRKIGEKEKNTIKICAIRIKQCNIDNLAETFSRVSL